jgi:hypothetical protein
LRRSAVQCAAHGWPVIPGACLVGDRFSCGPGCRTIGCHPSSGHADGAPLAVGGLALCDRPLVESVWRQTPHAVLLSTGVAFDVIEAPAWLAATIAHRARLGPVALTPTGRWMFLVRPGGALHPELAALPDVLLHAEGSWIPAPPTATPQGRVRWIVSPDEVDWRPAPAQLLQEWLVGGLPALRGGHPVRLLRAA